MAPILYKKDFSPPSRSAMLLAKALDMEIEYNDVDMVSGEHLSEEYREKNPQHTIPMLEDEDFILVDSHAIMIYLWTKYGGEDHADMYPDDAQTRALINHRLYFNCGTLQGLIKLIATPFFFEGKTTIEERLVDKTIEAYGQLEKFLGEREWLVGDNLTLADLAVVPSVTSLNILVPIDEDACPKLMEWLARMQELPYYEANAAGLEQFKSFYDSVLESAAAE